MHEPSYMEAHRNGKLADSIDKVVRILENCILCPRECSAARREGITRLDSRKRKTWIRM